MEKRDPSAWLSRVISFIKEYIDSNPGYSHRNLADSLQKNYFLRSEDAEKLVGLVEKEWGQGKIGLAAIELNLTFNCNLTCAYCFIHKKSPQDRMSFETAKRAIDLLVEQAVFPTVIITMIGGEPLLEFELIKQIVPYALEAAGKRNLQVTWAMTTNGTLVNEEMLKFLSRHQINLLLSIDGGPATHDRYRRTRSGEGTWQKIVDLIPLIKTYQPWLGARMTVSREAVGTMREDFKQIVDLGINQLIIAPAQGAKTWSLKEIEQYGLNLLKILGDYHELKRQGVPIFIEEFEKDENEYLGWGCRAGSTSLAVAPNGDLSPCSKLLGLIDETGRAVVGNVHSNINFELLEPFRNALSRQPGHCKGCSRKCAGGCYAVNFEQTGNHFLPSEENCLFWVVCQETKRMSKRMSMTAARCSGCYGRDCGSWG